MTPSQDMVNLPAEIVLNSFRFTEQAQNDRDLRLIIMVVFYETALHLW